MAEAVQIQYKHADLVKLMLRDQEIHEGLWMISINFGFTVANVGPNNDEISPAAVIPIGAIGIQRVVEKGPLTVDAAVVNPRPA